MNVLVISVNRSFLPVPVMPLGACMIAEAAERAGHNVTFADLLFERDPLRAVEQRIEEARPDIIGLSVRNIDNNDMRDPSFFVADLIPLIERIRTKTKARIVLGGAAVSVMPEEILRFTGLRIAVTGDGEVVFPELLRRLSAGEPLRDVPGLARIEDDVFIGNPQTACADPRGGIAPDFSRWVDIRRYLSRLSSVPVQTKLGCHFRCVYCTYRKLEDGSYRLFTPESVASSVRRLASSGLRDIEFVDNVFNSPYGHAFALCETLAREKLPLRLCSIELNPAFLDDPLIEVMERSGFVGIGITVESAADKVLEALRKGYAAEDVARAAACVRRHNLPCLWIFMLGGPGETESTVKETLRFAEKHIRSGDTAFFNIGIRVYPGTELETIAREQGILSLAPKNMLPPVFYLSPEIDGEWLHAQLRGALDTHMNFINSDSLGLSYLPALHRLSYRLGIKSPLWRYTRPIRRALRAVGLNA
jgi:radical SAM superfamily enzyme YgiQ (UPF0313 family)